MRNRELVTTVQCKTKDRDSEYDIANDSELYVDAELVE